MTDRDQNEGREKNGAIPGGKPEASTSDAAVERTGRQGRENAGPDGPDPTVVGDTFKKAPAPSKPIDEAASAPGDTPKDTLAG